MAEGGRIVVGVDGSPASRSAIRWAIDEARLRRATLEVVHAWQFPAVALTSYGQRALPVIAPEDLEAVGHEVMNEMMAFVAADLEGVESTTSVQRGHPAEVLVTVATGADLLVVGSRGLGGFSGMLLGSVSSHVIHHTPCPVVVIRADES